MSEHERVDWASFLSGLAIGTLLGASIGVFVAGMAQAARDDYWQQH